MKPGRKLTARERAAVSPIKQITWPEWTPCVMIHPGAVITFKGRRYVAQRPRSPIRKASLKRERQLSRYHKRLVSWKRENAFCEAMVKGVCTTHTKDCHHMNDRHGEKLLDEQFWLPVCRACHDFIGNNKSWARQNGLLK